MGFLRMLGITFALAIWLKTFIAGFYIYNQYPRRYQRPENISPYSQPLWYIWTTASSNVVASFAGFWLFAGAYERLYSYFKPSYILIWVFLVEDVGVHLALYFMEYEFNMLMTVNISTTCAFIVFMMLEFVYCQTFAIDNPDQVIY